jgi:hypothetical protein
MARKPPSYCHHKGTGQARVTIQGRDHDLGQYGSPESLRRYGELIAAMDGLPAASSPSVPDPADTPTQPARVAASAPTLAEAMLRFTEYALAR